LRGSDEKSDALFSYVSCEARVPEDHPLRAIRMIVDEALEVLSPAFERLYSKVRSHGLPCKRQADLATTAHSVANTAYLILRRFALSESAA